MASVWPILVDDLCVDLKRMQLLDAELIFIIWFEFTYCVSSLLCPYCFLSFLLYPIPKRNGKICHYELCVTSFSFLLAHFCFRNSEAVLVGAYTFRAVCSPGELTLHLYEMASLSSSASCLQSLSLDSDTTFLTILSAWFISVVLCTFRLSMAFQVITA